MYDSPVVDWICHAGFMANPKSGKKTLVERINMLCGILVHKSCSEFIVSNGNHSASNYNGHRQINFSNVGNIKRAEVLHKC